MRRLTATFAVLSLLATTSCVPESNSTFKSTSTKNVAKTASTAKAWQTPTAVDPNDLDATYALDNNVATATGPKFPMAVSAYGNGQFSVSYHHLTCPNTACGSTNNRVWNALSTVFSSSTWATSLADLRILDNFTVSTVANPNVATVEARRPISKVDSKGNMVAIYVTSKTAMGGVKRTVANRFSATSASWTGATDISLAAAVAAGNPTLEQSMALAVDSSDDVVALWCQKNAAGNPTPYWNEFRTTTGAWRFSTTTTDDNTVDTTTTFCSSNDLGLDVGFDTNGGGAAAFISNVSNKAVVKRWAAETWTGAIETLSGATTQDSFPKLFLDTAGIINIAVYRNFNIGTGAGDLFVSNGTASTAFVAPTQLDAGIGAGSTLGLYTGDTFTGGTMYLPPVLAGKGSTAVLLFVKSNGTTRRLWASFYQGSGSWSTPAAIDPGAAGQDVVWADAAVNSSGQIAVAYARIASDGKEHVFANFYTSGAWNGETQVDSLSSLSPAVAPDATRPSVAIDVSGNIVVTFTMKDSSGKRRAYAAIYR